MGDWIDSALLGMLQGITEFLPISSTCHLLFLEKVLQFTPPPCFDTLLQLGSGLAIVSLYFKKFFFPDSKQERNQLFSLLIIATIPAVIAGALLHQTIRQYIYGSHTIGISLILGGLIFFLIEHRFQQQKTSKKITRRQATIVGISQAFALIPGVSRSGATIASGLYSGVQRATAIEFSFLLAIPVLFGAGLFDFLTHMHTLSSQNIILISIGFISSFFTSLLAIQPLLALLQYCGLNPFGWYRIAMGILILTF